MNQRLKELVARNPLLYVGLFLAALSVAVAFAVPALAAQLTYYSTNVSVTTASSTVLAANSGFQTLTVQNTDASGTVYVSFTCPATTADLKLSAGAAAYFDQAPKNAVCAVGSGTINVAITGGKL